MPNRYRHLDGPIGTYNHVISGRARLSNVTRMSQLAELRKKAKQLQGKIDRRNRNLSFYDSSITRHCTGCGEKMPAHYSHECAWGSRVNIPNQQFCQRCGTTHTLEQHNQTALDDYNAAMVRRLGRMETLVREARQLASRDVVTLASYLRDHQRQLPLELDGSVEEVRKYLLSLTDLDGFILQKAESLRAITKYKARSSLGGVYLCVACSKTSLTPKTYPDDPEVVDLTQRLEIVNLEISSLE